MSSYIKYMTEHASCGTPVFGFGARAGRHVGCLYTLVYAAPVLFSGTDSLCVTKNLCVRDSAAVIWTDRARPFTVGPVSRPVDLAWLARQVDIRTRAYCRCDAWHPWFTCVLFFVFFSTLQSIWVFENSRLRMSQLRISNNRVCRSNIWFETTA